MPQDSKGTEFNAAIHESKNGQPNTTKDGRYRLKRGRKAGQVTTPATTDTASAVPAVTAA